MSAYGRAAQRASATLFPHPAPAERRCAPPSSPLPGGREWHILQKFRIAIDILAHYHSMNYLFIFNYLGV
jgi:hypothetical protein